MTRPLSTILLVEDSEDDAFALRRALKKLGVLNPLQLATDGQQAVEQLAEAAQLTSAGTGMLPCLVLLDLKLPRKDGFAVLEWIRTQPALAGLLIVMLTGSEELRDQQRAYALGARSYLVKPASVTDLKQLLDSLEPHWMSARVGPIVLAANAAPSA